MQSFIKSMRARLLGTLSVPREFPQSGFHLIAKDKIIDEETLPSYKCDHYYPARIGEVLNGRYQIVGKLGFGMTSTVWMCKDLRTRDYHTIKICTRNASLGIVRGENRELAMLRQLKLLHSNHPGKEGIRTMEDTFPTAGSDQDQHIYILHQPLGNSLWELQSLLGGFLPEDLLKATVVQILLALDFLHSEAHLVHTDLQARNILLGIDNPSVLAEYEEAEMQHPTARKVDGDRVIYQCRALRSWFGLPVIIDFGEAREANTTHRDDIMPNAYRAPEVVLDVPWDYKVDIWNLGVLIWTLFESQSLFSGVDSDGDTSNPHHLAEMVALLGPAPAEFAMQGALGSKYFYEDGSWKGVVDLPQISSENIEKRLDGNDKALFLNFMRKMLQWDPAKRSTAKDLIFDDYLTSQYNSNR